MRTSCTGRRVPRIVADAKYKLESGRGRYPNTDHYQMLAYCTALRVPVAWLVYASGAHGPVTRRVRNAGIEIVEYLLQLDVTPSALLTQVADLAATSWDRSASAPVPPAPPAPRQRPSDARS